MLRVMVRYTLKIYGQLSQGPSAGQASFACSFFRKSARWSIADEYERAGPNKNMRAWLQYTQRSIARGGTLHISHTIPSLDEHG